MNSNNKVEKQYLLILGAPRSGTTLLTTMIGRHSEVGLLNEDKGWAMKQIVGKTVVGNKRCIPNQIELQKRSPLAARCFKDWGLIKEYQSSKYSIEDYLQLPNLKILGLIRRGEDVIASNMGRGRKDFKAASYRWCRAIEILDALKSRHDRSVMIVCFEDLVLHPEANMRRVAEFLALEFEERMLEGPHYNPYYPESSFNVDKANSTDTQKERFRLEETCAASYETYRRLLSLSQ